MPLVFFSVVRESNCLLENTVEYPRMVGPLLAFLRPIVNAMPGSVTGPLIRASLRAVDALFITWPSSVRVSELFTDIAKIVEWTGAIGTGCDDAETERLCQSVQAHIHQTVDIHRVLSEMALSESSELEFTRVTEARR